MSKTKKPRNTKTQTQNQSPFSDPGIRSPFEIGAHYLIRTVTMINTGTLVAEYPEFLVLNGAAWVADTGRFADALKDPSRFGEVEPFPGQVIVGKGGIIDACVIPGYTPTQK